MTGRSRRALRAPGRRSLAATWRHHDAERSIRAEGERRGPIRRAALSRRTAETSIRCAVSLDGSGKASVDTGIGFLDHMLASLARHGRIDLRLRARGDLRVDQHHTVEDVGLVLGRAMREALGDARGIRRAGCFLFPMDEAIGYAAVDLGGRSHLAYDVRLSARFVGGLEAGLVEDMLAALARELRAAVHVAVPAGRSDHHALEAAFKALGKALREAFARDPRARGGPPSTKGIVD